MSAFWKQFPFRFQNLFFYSLPPPPHLLFSLNFSQNGNPSELPKAMPVGSLGVCLGSVVMFGDGVFLHRCKSWKPRSVMQNRLSGVATLELQVLAGSHWATQVTWQETRQIYNENLLSRLGSLGRFIESQMFSWNVLLLTNRHFLMEKNFLSENFLWALSAAATTESGQELCGKAKQHGGQCPRASQLLLCHTRGAHHTSGFRTDLAVLPHCRMPSGGSWPHDNHPQCSPASSTCVQTKPLPPH